MTLSAKGRIAPPPVLAAPFRTLSEEVQSWPGIVAATHWHLSRNGQVDGADFYRGADELGHIHLYGEVHLVTTPSLTRALVDARLVRPFPFAGAKDWSVYRIQSDDGLRHAEWLMRLAYDYLGGTSEVELLDRVSAALQAA